MADGIDENKYSFPQVILLALLFLPVFAAGAFSFWLYQQKMRKKAPTTPSNAQIISASSQLFIAPSSSPYPTQTPKSDLEAIKEAMAKKYGKPTSEVNITISKTDALYASGAVVFFGETGGDWFLAYKNPDGWIIANYGNGTIHPRWPKNV